jgi:hypothetical protein
VAAACGGNARDFAEQNRAVWLWARELPKAIPVGMVSGCRALTKKIVVAAVCMFWGTCVLFLPYTG